MLLSKATYIAFKLQFNFFYQLLLSLGIEPMILALLAPCSTIWATGKLKTLQFSCIKFKAIKSFKYVKWYKKSLSYNFKRSCSWWRKDKNRDTTGLNFRRQWCHWIHTSAAHFKVKTQRRCLYVNVSLKGTICLQKRVVGIFISSCL